MFFWYVCFICIIQEDYANKIILKSQKYINQISDSEHNKHHINDVINYIKLLIEKIEDDFDVEAVIIAGYWHDVGKIKTEKGHEQLSAQILKDAGKLARIGRGRWKESLKQNQWLDNITELLPKLREEILYFQYSKSIYDKEILIVSIRTNDD